MPKYLVIKEGSSPRAAEPILVSSDSALITLVARAVSERLGALPQRRHRPANPPISIVRPNRDDEADR